MLFTRKAPQKSTSKVSCKFHPETCSEKYPSAEAFLLSTWPYFLSTCHTCFKSWGPPGLWKGSSNHRVSNSVIKFYDALRRFPAYNERQITHLIGASNFQIHMPFSLWCFWTFFVEIAHGMSPTPPPPQKIRYAVQHLIQDLPFLSLYPV